MQNVWRQQFDDALNSYHVPLSKFHADKWKKEVTSHAQGKERLFLRICAVGTPNLNRTLFLLPFTTCYSRDINMSKTLMKMFSFVEAEILQGMLAFAYKGR